VRGIYKKSSEKHRDVSIDSEVRSVAGRDVARGMDAEKLRSFSTVKFGHSTAGTERRLTNSTEQCPSSEANSR
jgi:hypothetical protein